MRAPARIYATEELLREMDEGSRSVGGGLQDAEKAPTELPRHFPHKNRPERTIRHRFTRFTAPKARNSIPKDIAGGST
jgi:hypothetical protein